MNKLFKINGLKDLFQFYKITLIYFLKNSLSLNNELERKASFKGCPTGFK